MIIKIQLYSIIFWSSQIVLESLVLNKPQVNLIFSLGFIL